LHEKLAGATAEALEGEAPLVVEQFPGGHSNLTYLLRLGTREFVMRRPPFGPVPPKAHDMAREYHILEAVHPVYPLAPRPFLLCEDASVIGSVFYVMERRRGLVVRSEEPPALAERPVERRRASAALVDALADLHAVDIEANGLGALGRPAGFVERQVRGWSERWHGSQTTELPVMDALAAWLVERLPPGPQRPTLVHGDFKLDNVMLDARDVGRIVGVFDWEMSTVGDPLVDLGIMLAYWVHTSLASASRDTVASVTHLEGWYTRAEILERYGARTGFDLKHITFYEVFAVFKLAVVLQQIFYRYSRGQTDDPRFAQLDERVTWLARTAATLAEKA
jgi:aminoglycoside phosphotransferase (APT) family kinase protein